MRKRLARWLTNIRIRTRLQVVYIGLIVIGFAMLTLISGGQTIAAVRSDYGQGLQNSIRLVAQGISPSVSAFDKGQMTQDQLDAAVAEYETQVGGALTLYVFNEQKRTSGTEDETRRPSFYGMPEIETALRGETVLVERQDDSGESVLYTAAPVMNERQPRGVIQLGVPARVLTGLVMQRWIVLILVFVVVTSLALLAAWWMSQSIIHPLYKLRDSALHLSRGDFSHRVTFSGKDEIAEVAAAFNEMAKQVQSMLEEQRAFASNTSHELRTPLTAIRLRTDALRNDSTLDQETSRRYIEEIDNEAASLGNLIQDLTLLSRFDAGRAELGHEEIDFGRLGHRLHQKLLPQAQEKRITFDLSLPEEPAPVNASLVHLSVVFRNLLDNALKYTPEGGAVTWEIKPQPKGILHTIRDTGAGIAPQHMPHIYERFYRGDKARSRETPGTGLGLALVRSIVEAYGGSIRIESEGAGKGTIVTVFWPCSVDNAISKRKA